MDEVRRHSAPDDAWTVLSGRVYNMTPYMPYHPGGAAILMQAAGKDGTALFRRYHPWVNGHALLEACLLGSLKVRRAPRAPRRALCVCCGADGVACVMCGLSACVRSRRAQLPLAFSQH